MSDKHFNIHLPLVEKDGMTYAILIGEPEVEVGQILSLKEVASMEFHYDMYLRDYYQGPLLETPQDLLANLGYANFSALRMELVNTTRISLGAEVKITILMMADPEVEIAVEESDTLEVSESTVASDIVEVVEDSDDDVWYADEEEILDIVDDED